MKVRILRGDSFVTVEAQITAAAIEPAAAVLTVQQAHVANVNRIERARIRQERLRVSA